MSATPIQRPCPGNDPWRIVDATRTAIVRRGCVDLFAIGTGTNGEPGHRRFLARCPEGAMLVPLDSGRLNGMDIIAVGSADTMLELGPEGRRSDVLHAAANEAVDFAAWVDVLLLVGNSAGDADGRVVALSAASVIALTAGSVVGAHDRVLWCQTKDIPPATAMNWPSSMAWRPITSRHAGRVTADITVAPRSTVDALTLLGDPAAVLDEATTLLSRAIEDLDRQAADLDRDVLVARMKRRAATARASVDDFGTVFGDKAQSTMTVATSDAVIAAARRMAEALHTPFILPPSWPADGTGRIELLLEASRMRSRIVVLEGTWYHDDAGPLIGFDKSGAAVTMLREGRHYVAVDVDGGRTVISSTTVGNYAERGLQVYRPFPATAMLFRDILRFGFGPLRKDLLLLLLAGCAGGLLSLFLPSITATIFDQVIPTTDRSQLLLITVGIVLAGIVGAIFELTRNVAVLRLQLQSDATLQGALWDRLLSLPATFFRRFTAGELATRANGFNAIQQLIAGATANSMVAFIFSTFQLIILFHHSTKLAWIALLILVLAALCLALISYGRYRYLVATQDVYQKITGVILQLLSAISKLRATASETYAFRMWSSMFLRQRRNEFKASGLQNLSQILYAVVPTIASMVFYWIIHDMAVDGKSLATGSVLSFLAAFSTFFASLLACSTAAESMLMCVPLYSYARPILETPPEVDEARPDPGRLHGDIDVVNVSFRYEAEGPLILDGVSISARAGEFIAVVGASGCGKSTLLRLLLGFETPEAGGIYFDGQDIAGVDIRAVRRQMGVVLQNGRVMSGDIFKNIVSGNPLLTIDDAWEAAASAGFDEDIHGMPMGMHTVISEGGSTLSGGQRQRLLIARAIASKPRIILMDEATSALDNRTQQIVTEALGRMHATRIIIAHRLSTIIHADRIYVMDRGRVMESGTYQDLMTAGGAFAALARRQIA